MKFHRPMIKSGDKRTVTRFAFLPERIDDNTVVWLETYKMGESKILSIIHLNESIDNIKKSLSNKTGHSISLMVSLYFGVSTKHDLFT